MTNTNFIGGVQSYEDNDRITPHTAYKVVTLHNPDGFGKIQISGPHYTQHLYGFVANSKCDGKEKCEDFSNCSCGFYGYSDVNKAVQHWRSQCSGYASSVLVEVAFSGRVVVCADGFRAETQRIRNILAPRCLFCSNAGEVMTPHARGVLVPICLSCVKSKEESFNSKKRKFLRKNKKSEPVAIQTFTFERISELISIEGMKPIKVGSAKALSKEAAGFFNYKPEPVPVMEDVLKDEETDQNGVIPLNFDVYLKTLSPDKMEDLLKLVSEEMSDRAMDSFNK